MEKYLKYSLSSIIRQDLEDIEIICINDGSTDASLRTLKEYQEKDKRIKVINQRNQGVAKTRNLGICMAVGKYISFLDPDDYLPQKDIMSALYHAAETNNVFIAGGEFSDIDKNGKINAKYEGTLAGYSFEKDGIIYYSEYQFDYGYHRFIYNREFLNKNKIEFPELVRFQDPPFMVQAFTMAEKFYAMKKVTYCYRIDYRMIQWNQKKVKDLLTGLYMNLRWAAKHQLSDLVDLTVERMVNEYHDIILAQFLEDNEVRDIVYQILNDERLNQNEKLKGFAITIYDYLIQQYKSALNSKSYQVGSMITFLPRKIRKIFLSIARKK